MKIVKPSHKILIPESPYKHIEKIGRICYKSEDAITDTSAEPFVQRLFNSGHHAMLEHFRFIVEVNYMMYTSLSLDKYNKYIRFTDDGRYIISGSSRGLCDLYKYTDRVSTKVAIAHIVNKIVSEYDCQAIFGDIGKEGVIVDKYMTVHRVIKDFDELSDIEYNMHAWYSVHFVCDRGVTHEMVRHRDASFAQESTRYCNYSKGKYDNEITVIEPLFWNPGAPKYNLWRLACEYSENMYLDLIKFGATPQEARSVLPNSLKTEIVITAQIYEWRHIFNLRVHGKTGAPHPQMKEVMEPVYNDMVQNNYLRK